ncbi:MAG: hypothetical protein RR263_01515 [Oscillospiraceae bacterium]
MSINIPTVFLWLMIYSFIGWVYESTLCSITGKKLVNRGFLNGPICPIYGFGAVVVIFCFQGSAANGNIIALFLSSAVLTCILEYFTSWAMEKLFQTRWWDYSEHRFQLNGRVCLLGAVAFGTMSVILLKIVHPIVAGLVEAIPLFWRNMTFLLLLSLVIADMTVTIKSILSLNNKLQEIQDAINMEKEKHERHLEKIKNELQERNEELKNTLNEYSFALHLPYSERKEWLLEKFNNSEFFSEKIAHLIEQKKYNEQRLLNAFPRMKSMENNDALSSLKIKHRTPRK